MPIDYQFTDKDVHEGKTYFYYIEDIDILGNRNRSSIISLTIPVSKVEVIKDVALPEKFALFQNYPNPFNPETWLPYELAADVTVTLGIYSVKGQLVRQLDVGYQQAGSYLEKGQAAYWDGKDQTGSRVSSGLYFYQFTAGNFQSIRRMVIVK